jgi:hypothetical protein
MAGNTAETATSGKTTVKYVGMLGVVDIRQITAAEWKAIGVEDGKLRRWTGDWDNAGRSITDDFSAGELAYLESDPDFKVTRS